MPDSTDKEIRDALIRKAEELTQQNKEREEKRNDFMKRMQKQHQIELMQVQHRCSHRKGGSWTMMKPDVNSPEFLKFQPKLPLFNFDFNVMLHTFIDGKQMIKCLSCNRSWVTGDPDFNEAMRMVLASTNRPSASQRVPQAEPNAPQGAVDLVKPLRKSFWKRFWNALITKETKVVTFIDDEIIEDQDLEDK